MRRFLISCRFAMLASWPMLLLSGGAAAQVDGATEAVAGQDYEVLLERYQDWTYEDLCTHLGIKNGPSESLSFDPESAANYDAIRRNLKMTAEEHSIYKRNGLVVMDVQQRHSFASSYYQIYAQDLPVLVTTDSVLHAWHRSYDNLLEALESYILKPSLEALIRDCHEELAKRGNAEANWPTTAHRDVDLYLTVARNLLAGAGGPRWRGELQVPSVFDMDVKVREMLAHIKSLELQVQYPPTDATEVYGGRRFVDYSQFAPRGHYAQTSHLQHYFRAMMWLGRADCGFHFLPVDPTTGLIIDWRRELRNAALLSHLVRDSGNDSNLRAMAELHRLLVGRSDNLSVPQMLATMDSEQVADVEALSGVNNPKLEWLAASLSKSGEGQQQIRSQSIVSNPYDDYKVPPPALFQVFGQSFAADAFVLSHTVFDSILFEGTKQTRMMPSSLDVAAALGNPLAARLLEPELRNWNYSANLIAGREFLSQLSPEFWDANVYHSWLDALRTLDDPPPTGILPEVMRSAPWQAKQLQTQLSSWSELRHDNILYAKQSYTGVPGCSYPDAYVEPYPVLYRKLGSLATTTASRLQECEFAFDDSAGGQWRAELFAGQIKFLTRFAEIMAQLETISELEVEGKPMTEEQRRFLEATVDRRGTVVHGSGTKPRYDGWYCDLIYNDADPTAASPTVADVHTNPTDHKVLQVGIGNVNFAVIAVDSGEDVGAFIGPVYSFYEFTRQAEARLDDQTWEGWISQDLLPPRPEWTSTFVATPFRRSYGGLSVHSGKGGWQVDRWVGGTPTPVISGRTNDEGLRDLLNFLQKNGYPNRFGLMAGQLSDAGLASLADVPQLTWVDVESAKITAAAIEQFQLRRPDVEILVGDFTLRPLMTLVEKADAPSIKWDTVKEWTPGQEAAIHVGPVNPAWIRDGSKLIARLKVTATWLDEDGAPEARQDLGLVELNAQKPWQPVRFTVPRSLQPGSKVIRILARDIVASPSQSAAAETSIEIVSASSD
ncbi:DUF3160 domain-containing protein [Pirellulales bacterium]|nr:DUF3160 domain-containing protein [Pirellulales bacterium]